MTIIISIRSNEPATSEYEAETRGLGNLLEEARYRAAQHDGLAFEIVDSRWPAITVFAEVATMDGFLEPHAKLPMGWGRGSTQRPGRGPVRVA